MCPYSIVLQSSVAKSMSINSKFLPQGSCVLIAGKTSVLLQDSGPPARSLLLFPAQETLHLKT